MSELLHAYGFVVTCDINRHGREKALTVTLTH
jgi:hypothetical protein